MSAESGLELAGIRKSFGGTPVLADVSLTVAPGRVFGFVGPNGAGKTTTMRIIMGLLEPDGGRVVWRGRPVTPDDRRLFGYMPEERGLYPKMRVREQLVFFARIQGLTLTASSRAADQLLERLGLQDRAGDRVETLSLGNQQRVQLACALVHGPCLLVLDEPFSGLDPVGVEVLADVLAERVENGAAVIFSSHQLDLVQRLCDSVGVLARGTVVPAGDPTRSLTEVFRDLVTIP